MLGIDPEIICHKLSIWADAKPEEQKPRRMNEERSRAISDEVDCYSRLALFEKYSTPIGSLIPSS